MAIINEYEAFNSKGGFFVLDKNVLKITGADATDFLHRMTTQNIKDLRSGNGSPAAILQSNGALIAPFEIYNTGNFFLIVVDRNLATTLADHLEKFHFAEDFTISDVSEEFKVLSVQGVAASVLRDCGYKIPKVLHEMTGAEDCFVIQEPDFGTHGFRLLVKATSLEGVQSKLAMKGIKPLSMELWSLLRNEAGFFSFGADVTEKNIILEAPLDGYVSRDKGCYPGQEVVERIFTYGNVAKKLVGLEWISPGTEPAGTNPRKLFVQGKEVGTLTSLHFFPWNKKYFGFGVIRKPFYEPGQDLEPENGGAKLRVVRLPLTFDIHRELERDHAKSTANS